MCRTSDVELKIELIAHVGERLEETSSCALCNSVLMYSWRTVIGRNMTQFEPGAET